MESTGSSGIESASGLAPAPEVKPSRQTAPQSGDAAQKAAEVAADQTERDGSATIRIEGNPPKQTVTVNNPNQALADISGIPVDRVDEALPEVPGRSPVGEEPSSIQQVEGIPPVTLESATPPSPSPEQNDPSNHANTGMTPPIAAETSVANRQDQRADSNGAGEQVGTTLDERAKQRFAEENPDYKQLQDALKKAQEEGNVSKILQIQENLRELEVANADKLTQYQSEFAEQDADRLSSMDPATMTREQKQKLRDAIEVAQKIKRPEKSWLWRITKGPKGILRTYEALTDKRPIAEAGKSLVDMVQRYNQSKRNWREAENPYKRAKKAWEKALATGNEQLAKQLGEEMKQLKGARDKAVNERDAVKAVAWGDVKTLIGRGILKFGLKDYPIFIAIILALNIIGPLWLVKQLSSGGKG